MTDVENVAQLVLHERRARDRGWWSAMRDCFGPDAHVRLSWFDGSGEEFVAASEQMAARGHPSVHRLGPPAVDLHGDRAVVELPAGIELAVEADGVAAVLTSYARLLYRVSRRDDRWRIRSLDPVYERDALVPDVPGTALRFDADELAGYRPSYRLLAHHLHTLGYDLTEDLYGDDRPDDVADLYRTLFAWLNGTDDD